jgi:hypothetical protein
VAEAAAAVAAAMQPVAKGAALAARAKSAVVCAFAKQLQCASGLRNCHGNNGRNSCCYTLNSKFVVQMG